ncbi:hypothetical protein CC2G_006230 [Coprinopsis cinerea AmutBmut pab1-1]|nr:hypothetical protein CC2G_006230 [Coprinopsis cinerea AmutBmut pab1-1]
MSTLNAFSKKPDLRLPPLPTELWSVILRQATAQTDPLRPPLYTIYPRPTSTKANRRWREAIITKRCVVRVCKLWHSLAVPFLYEYLVISDSQVFPSLLEGVGKLWHVKYRPETTVGNFTSRLDVVIRDPNPPEALHPHLSTLLRRLPRLLVLSIYMPFREVAEGPLLCSYATPSLECISWLGAPVAASRWVDFLAGHPNLKSIGAPDLSLATAPQPLETPLQNVSELGGLNYVQARTLCEEWISPRRLHHLSIQLSNGAGMDFDSPEIDQRWCPFMSYGPNLTSLHITSNAWGGRIGNLVNRGLRHCPNLQQLVLSHSHWP